MTQFDVLLLADAVQRIVANPGSAECWHLLNQLYGDASQELQGEAIALLSAHTPDEGVAGFLKHTFLASKTAGFAHFARAGEILEALAPLDPDRIAAFMLFTWARLVILSGGHADFAKTLADARFPQLNRRAGQALEARVGQLMPARPVTQVRKVALVTAHMATLEHTPTRMALDQMRVLVALGYEVELFTAQEQTPPDMEIYLGTGSRSRTPAADSAKWADYLQLGRAYAVNAHIANPRLSMLARWTSMMRPIAAFDPDLVFFVGLYSPLLVSLQRRRPVLALSTHAVAPLAPCDAWLCADARQAQRSSAPWGPDIPASYACHHPYRIRHQSRSSAPTRAALGLPTDKLILVTVGARLPSEINGAWAARMRDLLQQHGALAWVLVGGTGEMPAALQDCAGVTALRHQADIGGLLGLCDIFVNPPRVGGGFSVAEAMAEAVPVVALHGSDGGNKVGALAARDVDDYFDLLRRLIDSQEARTAAGAQMRSHFEQTLSLDHSHQSLGAALEQARDLYHRRMAGALTPACS